MWGRISVVTYGIARVEHQTIRGLMDELSASLPTLLPIAPTESAPTSSRVSMRSLPSREASTSFPSGGRSASSSPARRGWDREHRGSTRPGNCLQGLYGADLGKAGDRVTHSSIVGQALTPELWPGEEARLMPTDTEQNCTLSQLRHTVVGRLRHSP